MEFALLVILLMWASHSRVSLRQTPRYDVDETFASVSSLRVIFQFFFISAFMNIALRRFLHNHSNIATEGSPKTRLCHTLISNDFKGSL